VGRKRDWAERVASALFHFYFVFFFFFFSFLIYFVSFAKMLQINSNHFQKFSKNQCNDLTLQKTSFSEFGTRFSKGFINLTKGLACIKLNRV
jgi:hypothetical protein